MESGIGVMFLENAKKNGAPKIVGSYQPEMVGQPGWEFVMGKKSGTYSVDNWLNEMGIEGVAKEQKLEILNMVKDLAFAEKRLITKDEFKGFVEKVKAS